jgi:GNAT superfamily N-acetyltransferase
MQLSDSEIKQQTRRLWETVFGDSQDFIDLYFSKKYTPAANMVRIEDGVVVAAAQWLPYEALFWGVRVKSSYLSGLVTRPDCRGKGHAAAIIGEGLKRLYAEDVPLAWLIPANESLRDLYERPSHGCFYTSVFRVEKWLTAQEHVAAGFEAVNAAPSVAIMQYVHRALSRYGTVLLPSLSDVQAAFALCEMEQGKAVAVLREGNICGLALAVKETQDEWRLSFMETDDSASEAALLAALAAVTGAQRFRSLQPAIFLDDKAQSYGMVRVVNVERLLQLIRPTLPKQEMCVEVVADEVLPQNNGRYLLSKNFVGRTDQPAEMQLTPGKLAALLMQTHEVSMPMMLDE